MSTPAFMDRLRQTAGSSARWVVDSRRVQPGDVFVALPGRQHDGRDHVAQAIKLGACAVLWEAADQRPIPHIDVPVIEVPGLKEKLGHWAAEWFDFPTRRMATIGVTGTSGKTSCTLWIAQALKARGNRPIIAGTLGMGWPDRLMDTGLTTPDACGLQSAADAFARQGADTLVMEVSSIGLDEGRVDGVDFAVALFTNLSRDHLDYHGTMDAYRDAKRRLFERRSLKTAVINAEDAASETMIRAAHESGANVVAFSANGRQGAQVVARNVAWSGKGLSFEMGLAGQFRPVTSALIGTYNLENLLGVAGVLLALGWQGDEIAATLETLSPPAGRMQRVNQRDDGEPLVLVDYAHKPDALRKAIESLQPFAKARGGRLMTVFGCGGDRDRGKRPLMGAIGAAGSDQLIITSDNPRSEVPEAIIADIQAGIEGKRGPEVLIEPDRRAAIRLAIEQADERDVILIAGKGHETYQEVAGQRLPFSDLEEAQSALSHRLGELHAER